MGQFRAMMRFWNRHGKPSRKRMIRTKPADATTVVRRASQPGHTERGFTLIEILIVVMILGILAAIVVPNFMDAPDKALLVKAKQDIRNFETALDIYKLDNFTYPSTDQGLESLVRAPAGNPPAPNWKEGGYVKRLQKDPWGNDYLYVSPGAHGRYDVYSLGADGELGGDGYNEDIGNWANDG